MVWFSCGAASAVAAKLTLEKYREKLLVDILYTDPGYEHPDNKRFMLDCEKWYGQKIKILKSEKYEDIYDVFEKSKFLVSPYGAMCTTELKKKPRRKYENLETDIQVFGFDITEKKRAERFKNGNPEVSSEFPLIDKGIKKTECFKYLKKADIEIPAMYKLGYKNNNCIGCVKGGAGYWNKIRRDFPDVFKKMAKLERKLNISIITRRVKKELKRVFLDELDPNAGRYKSEMGFECGVLCQS